jgi:hypothetical protein
MNKKVYHINLRVPLRIYNEMQRTAHINHQSISEAIRSKFDQQKNSGKTSGNNQ